MRIGRAGQNIFLDQAQYLQTVLERCGMQNAKAVPTPLPAGYAPTKSMDKAANPELRSRYQTVIGSLLYLMLGTRPDISFAVTKMAQFAANPTEDHLKHALYICRYLIGTPNYRLTYNGAGGQGLSACTDSDWASDVNTRRSTSGYFIKLAHRKQLLCPPLKPNTWHFRTVVVKSFGCTPLWGSWVIASNQYLYVGTTKAQSS